MNAEQIMKIFADTAYIRTGGSPEELRTAQYLQDKIAGLGLKAEIVPLDVPMSRIQEAVLQVGGVEVTCKGYLCAGSGEVEAPFYYLRDSSPYALSKCRGKIVMIDGYLGYWVYHDLLENGAVGFVTYDGNTNYADRDIDQRELRSYVHNGNRIPGVNINAKDAVELIRRGASTAKITLKQEEYTGQSHNVVLDMPGQVDEYIAFTAHYDSTSLSQGAYDNMSGSLGILGIAEHFAAHPPPLRPALHLVRQRGAGTARLQGVLRRRGEAQKLRAEHQSGHDRLHYGQVYLLRHRRGKAVPLYFLSGRRAGLPGGGEAGRVFQRLHALRRQGRPGRVLRPHRAPPILPPFTTAMTPWH